jgi:hypothetical protein
MHWARLSLKRHVLLLALMTASGGAFASSLPPIIASAQNPVPKCVTPAALMQFVDQRNARHSPPRKIEPRFDNVAALYQGIGRCVSREPDHCVGVRWDYAFFQMLIETGYLTFGGPDATGGVPARDNNFAGLGATEPGKPGERFKDVKTGVLAHLQHVLMYSRTLIPHPVAKRTRLVQNDVREIMSKLHRPVTFADLAQVWTGVDKSGYARDMQAIAERFHREFCGEQQFAEGAVKNANTRSATPPSSGNDRSVARLTH